MKAPSPLPRRSSLTIYAAAILAVTILRGNLAVAVVADIAVAADANDYPAPLQHLERSNKEQPQEHERQGEEERCRHPPTPPEHYDESCDRSLQNLRDMAHLLESENLFNEDMDVVFLNMPEEKTYICPPEEDTEETNWLEAHKLGHPTRWVVYNHASGPVIVSRLDARGVEVSATTNDDDDDDSKSSSSSAVWPRGPILMPGFLAVVEGKQGQSFVVREYEEVLLPPSEGDLVDPSFEGVLPQPLPSPSLETRYVTNDGVMHVLGSPGRILMRHRMGNLFVRNLYGAECPLFPNDHGVNVGRTGRVDNFNNACNFLAKTFINKVGCPIDIYFTTQDTNPSDEVEKEGVVYRDNQCEEFTARLDSFSFENSYNGHSFVARMAHDQSLVARIDLDHDVVTDCPGPKRRVVDAADASKRAIQAGRPLGVPLVIMHANATNCHARAHDGVCRSVDDKNVDNASYAVHHSLKGARPEEGTRVMRGAISK